MTEPRTYTDTERNYLLTVHDDGTHELAVRDAYRHPPTSGAVEPGACRDVGGGALLSTVVHDIRVKDPRNPHEGDCIDTLCPDCGCCMHCVGPDCCTGGCRDSRCGCSL
jgi:hypothetical protein